MTRRGALALLAGAPAWPRNPPRFERTFLQPWRRHLEWSEAHWSVLFDWLAALRVREVALQWTSWNGIDYAELPVRMAGLMASRRMKLWLGLGFDDEFWRWPIDEEVTGRLAAWRARSVEQARRLAQQREVMRIAAGWYLPEEFDAARWGRAAGLVADHLGASRRELMGVSRKPVAVSGFPSGTAAEAGEYWGVAVGRRAVDQLWMQDGIGAGKMEMGRWGEWGRTVAAAVKPGRCRMGVIVEAFRMGAAGPVPAPGEELLGQMEAAREIATGVLTAFAIPEYLSPAGGAEGKRAGLRYAERVGVALPPHLHSNWSLPDR